MHVALGLHDLICEGRIIVRRYPIEDVIPDWIVEVVGLKVHHVTNAPLGYVI